MSAGAAAPVAAAPVVMAPSPSAAPGAAPAPASASLLPAPIAAGEIDGLMAVLLLQSRSRQDNAQHAMRQIGTARDRSRQELAAVRRALAKAAQAERKERRQQKRGKVFRAIACVAATIVSIAATVVSFGAAAPVAALAIAGLVVSLTATVASQTRAFQALGMNDKAASNLCLGLSIAGAVMSLGAGFANAGNAAVAGAEAARTASASANAARVATTVRTAATATRVAGVTTQAAATTAEAATMERAAHWHEVGADADTDALAAHHSEDQLQRLLLTLIAELEHAEQSAERTFDSLSSTIQTQCNTVATAGHITWNA